MGMTLAAGAEVLSPEAALQRAMAAKEIKMMAPAAVKPRLVFTQKADALPAAYVFDRGADAGYVVVAADDAAVAVLGYSDSGTIDAADMPDGLAYWLEYYAAEIERARAAGISAEATSAPAKASRKAISPMVATRWNQSSPYNNKCPLVGSTRTVTGCVATAMAQVMKYHNWPAKGTGSNSYTWNSTTLSMDFSTVTFDWDNMLNTYGSTATDAQNTAVATLMSACGISVNMNYGTGSSGAVSQYCATALINYFNYDGSLRYLTRDYFGLTEWENEVYNSLADGCPVLYGGQSASGGHEFVCDGYSSDGYFHFNWGWGGMSDGYFKLTSLNPGSQGIGGAGSGAGYNFDQDIIVGIKPYAGQSAGLGVIYNMSDFTVTQTTANLGSTINVSAQFKNGSSFAADSFKPGVAFVDANGNATYAQWRYSNTLSLNAGYYYTSASTYGVTLPSGLADGVYTVTPAYLLSDNWYTMGTALGKVGSVKMTVANGVATFAAPAAATLPQVTEYSFPETLYVGLAYTVNAKIENNGDLECYNTVYGRLTDSSNNTTLLSPMQVDLLAGESMTVDYSGTLSSSLSAGTYKFDFVAETGTDTYTSISDTKEVTINAKPATGTLKITSVSYESGSTVLPKDDLGVKVTLTCSGGVFYGNVDMYIFQNTSGISWSAVTKFPSETLYLNSGDTKELVFNSDFSQGEVGKQYWLIFYQNNSKISAPSDYFITLGDAVSGVDMVEVEAQPAAVELYNLNGQRVDENPAPGHYIMVKRMADGTAASQHVIIK